MKLVSFRSVRGGVRGVHMGVHVGVVRDDHIVDLSAWLSLPGSSPRFDMVDLIAMGEQGLASVRAALAVPEGVLRDLGALVPLDMASLHAPIPRPRKNVVCLGRNYAGHAAESVRAFGEQAQPPPEYPTFFTKATTSVIGPYDDIPYDPAVSTQMDWECELAVVIGRTGKNIRRAEAMSYVFGYMVLNDVSVRDLQRRHGGQYFKGKSVDGTCPIGPWLVTADEVGDPHNLELWTVVNGVEKQRDRTASMLFDVPAIIEHLSLGMTIEPGDIIATGTPEGVGFARTPPEFLRPGDVVECGVERIGSIRNHVRPVDRITTGE